MPSFPEVGNALARRVQARNDIQTKFLDSSFSNLANMSQARTERVLQARTDGGPPWSLRVVILLTSGLLLGRAIIYGVEKPAVHCTMVASLGVLVAAVLFLVLELSHPLIGEIGTSPDPLREVIQVASGSQ